MRIEKSLEYISDGSIYDIEDIVNADARGCEGCSLCCYHVGELVELSPYDVFQLKKATHLSFEDLLLDKIQLITNNKISIPYLKMKEDNGCSFLDAENRCSIHQYRPNICRLFPLGRVYLKDEFKYFLQVNACTKPVLYPIKIEHWLGIKQYEHNKAFIMLWYHLLKALSFRMKFIYDEEELKQMNEYLINVFYRVDHEEDHEFYIQFSNTIIEAKKKLSIII